VNAGDWDPLPELDALPGASPPPRQPQKPAPLPPPSLLPSQRLLDLPPGPADEGPVVAMQAKLSALPAPKDAIAVAVRRRVRKDRATRRLQRETAPRQVPTEPAAPVFDPQDEPRERESWFLSLPDRERARLQAVWQMRRQQLVNFARALRRDRRLRFAAAMVVFTGVAWLQWGMVSGAAALWNLAAGMIAGLAWAMRPLDRFWCAGTAIVAYYGCQLVPIIAAGQLNPWLVPKHLLLASVTAWISATVAMDAEMKQSGGFGTV
jgi:hypothetical protein